MNWYFKMFCLGVIFIFVVVEVGSSENISFPTLEEIESAFKRSFEKASYRKTLDGGRTQSAATRHKEMSQDVMSYRQHGYHPANTDCWKLQCVWKAMRNVARNIPQILSSSNNPRTRAETQKMCESHSSTYCKQDSKAAQCDPYQVYRSIDGTCNNLKNTRWGSAVQPFERFLPADYGEVNGPFDNIWSQDQCTHIKYFHGVSTLSDCKRRCLQRENCTAFNYNEAKEGCHLWTCPVPIPAPLSRNKYEGYAFNLTTGDSFSGPFDTIWNSSQCGHITYIHNVRSLSDCELRCLQNKDCTAFNYNEDKEGCHLWTCPVPIPAPLSRNKYEGYAFNLTTGSWSGPFYNVWNNDQCEYIEDTGYDGKFSLSGCQALCFRRPNCNAINWNPKNTICELRICQLPIPAPNWKRGYFGYTLSSGDPSLRRSKKDEELPNPRKISRALSNSKPREQPKVSLMLMQWGQFLDHDITLTPERELEEEVDDSKAIMCCDKGILKNSISLWDDCVPIDVTEDPYYQRDGRQCLRFIRSMPSSKDCGFTPMEQINSITAFVDGSMIYGSNLTVADSLRTKSRGLLKTTTHEGNNQPLPPRGSPTGYGPHKCPQAESMNKCFLAGDVRVDEIPGLTAMHTAFIRLHNIITEDLAKLDTTWKHDDERLYQETRRIVIALIQQITYRDWLPHVVGPTLMEEYYLETGRHGYRDSYNPDVNPSIRNVFATAAFRFGHSLIAELIKAAAPANNLPVPGRFFDISTIESNRTSPSSLLKGLTMCPAQPIDPVVEQAFTNSLFAEKPADDDNFYGLDLVSLNIQRGRDHGIPSYREWRKFCGLEDIKEFEDLKREMPDDIAETFNHIYHDIDDIDLFPAGLAENSIGDGILGPTFSCVIARQFSNTKHGDRFWYEREDQPKQFTPEQLNSIRSQGLVSILCKVSEHTTFKFQPDPFLVADDNGNKVMSCSSYNFINLQPWEEH